MRYVSGFSSLLPVILTLLSTSLMAGDSGLKDFRSDGCSLFPDKALIGKVNWCSCCLAHDIAYWQGGTASQRLKVDIAFRKCIYQKTGSKALAYTMYAGVRGGGHPVFPVWYRWGYGWPYRTTYHALTAAEKAMVEKKLQKYFSRDKQAGVCSQ
jgi:hypothetical protein